MGCETINSRQLVIDSNAVLHYLKYKERQVNEETAEFILDVLELLSNPIERERMKGTIVGDAAQKIHDRYRELLEVKDKSGMRHSFGECARLARIEFLTSSLELAKLPEEEAFDRIHGVEDEGS